MDGSLVLSFFNISIKNMRSTFFRIVYVFFCEKVLCPQVSLCMVQNYLSRFELSTQFSEDCLNQRANFLLISCSFGTLVTGYTGDRFCFSGKMTDLVFEKGNREIR